MFCYLVRVFYDYSSPTRASLGLGTYALRPQRDIAHGERASCKDTSNHPKATKTNQCRQLGYAASRAAKSIFGRAQ